MSWACSSLERLVVLLFPFQVIRQIWIYSPTLPSFVQFCKVLRQTSKCHTPFFLIIKNKKHIQKERKKIEKEKKDTKSESEFTLPRLLLQQVCTATKSCGQQQPPKAKAPLNWYSLSLCLSLFFSLPPSSTSKFKPLLVYYYNSTTLFCLSLHGHGHGRKKLRKKEKSHLFCTFCFSLSFHTLQKHPSL